MYIMHFSVVLGSGSDSECRKLLGLLSSSLPLGWIGAIVVE